MFFKINNNLNIFKYDPYGNVLVHDKIEKANLKEENY